jgi:hypothetical protein
MKNISKGATRVTRGQVRDHGRKHGHKRSDDLELCLVQADVSTSNPVPAAFGALTGALAPDVEAGASNCLGSSGSFGLSAASCSACGDVFFKN